MSEDIEIQLSPDYRPQIWPYSPTPILIGDTVVGHLHDDYMGRYITSIGKDREIQDVLEKWYYNLCERNERNRLKQEEKVKKKEKLDMK
jgi:hypothetical protein